MLLIYWLLACTPTLPIIGLSLSYRRIVSQKTKEVLRRLEALPAHYSAAYGSAGHTAARAQGERGELAQELTEFYNWRTYYVPVALLCLVAVVLAVIGLVYLGVDLGLPVDLQGRLRNTNATTIIAAGAAYLWSLNDLIRRHRSADVSSTSLHTSWLRILISGAVGAALGEVVKPELGNITALAIGGIPIESLRRYIAKRANLERDEEAETASFKWLQGANATTLARLADEDIESVQSLAFADPVRLLFRTNFEWNVILDLVDQAMLATVVGERMETLRTKVCLRSAIDFASLYAQMTNFDPDNAEDAGSSARARALLGEAAQALGISEAGGVQIGYQFYYDPLLQFVWRHWEAARKLRVTEEGEDQEERGAAPVQPSGCPVVPGSGAYPSLASSSGITEEKPRQ